MVARKADVDSHSVFSRGGEKSVGVDSSRGSAARSVDGSCSCAH